MRNIFLIVYVRLTGISNEFIFRDPFKAPPTISAHKYDLTHWHNPTCVAILSFPPSIIRNETSKKMKMKTKNMEQIIHCAKVSWRYDCNWNLTYCWALVLVENFRYLTPQKILIKWCLKAKMYPHFLPNIRQKWKTKPNICYHVLYPLKVFFRTRIYFVLTMIPILDKKN